MEQQPADNMSRLKGKKAIRSFARKLAEPDTIRELNMTPMMDLMTIILVFLLKNFSGSTSLITMDENLQVPPSTSRLDAREAVPVTITKKVILIEGEALATVTNGKVDSSQKEGDEHGYLITPIRDYLNRVSIREQKRAALTGETFDSELMVVADKSTPYRLLTEVLYSCGQAGYQNYRLVVLKPGD